MRRNIWVGLLAGCVVAVGVGAYGQVAFDPNVLKDLRIGGIEKWHVTMTNSEYVAEITVRLDNRSQYNIVLRKPAFSVTMKAPKTEDVDKERTQVLKSDKASESGNIHKVTPLKMEELQFGDATFIPKEGDKDDLILVAPAADKKVGETEAKFQVKIGPEGAETHARLIDIFNLAMNKDRQMDVMMEGTAKVGTSTGPMDKNRIVVTTSSPVEFTLMSKPRTVVDVAQ